jgi:hypothetical protein
MFPGHLNAIKNSVQKTGQDLNSIRTVSLGALNTLRISPYHPLEPFSLVQCLSDFVLSEAGASAGAAIFTPNRCPNLPVCRVRSDIFVLAVAYYLKCDGDIFCAWSDSFYTLSS